MGQTLVSNKIIPYLISYKIFWHDDDNLYPVLSFFSLSLPPELDKLN